MKKTLLKAIITTFVVAQVLFFNSCASNVDSKKNSSNIDGSWVFDSDNTELIIDLENDLLKFNDKANPYEGTELVVEEIDKKSGIVFFKQTINYEETDKDPENSSWTKVEFWYDADHNMVYSDPNDSNYTHYVNWYRWSETSPNAGKWFAVGYWSLTKDSVKLRFPWKQGGKNFGTETLEQAKDEYTQENGYFPNNATARRK